MREEEYVANTSVDLSASEKARLQQLRVMTKAPLAEDFFVPGGVAMYCEAFPWCGLVVYPLSPWGKACTMFLPAVVKPACRRSYFYLLQFCCNVLLHAPLPLSALLTEHDRMLADLGRGVGRLKTQSGMINEETSLHVRLLDDMEGDAERASSGLQTEARHAQKVYPKPWTMSRE